jgi:hypothetical protein
MCCNKNLTLFSGLTGPSGDYTIVTTEAPGVNCANGGVKIELFNGLTNALGLVLAVIDTLNQQHLQLEQHFSRLQMDCLQQINAD